MAGNLLNGCEVDCTQPRVGCAKTLAFWGIIDRETANANNLGILQMQMARTHGYRPSDPEYIHYDDLIRECQERKKAAQLGIDRLIRDKALLGSV